MADAKASTFSTVTPALADLATGLQGGANRNFSLQAIKDLFRVRADATIETNVSSNCLGGGFNAQHIVRAAAGVWYWFFASATNADLYYVKSSNYGVTWNAPVLVKSGITLAGLAVWFDKWTPGDSGTVIHLAYYETTTGDVFYRALDTNGDALGTEITVFNGASGAAGANGALAVAKSRAGRILVAYDIDGGTETGFNKSNDYPVTGFGAALGNPNEGASTDYYLLFPGNDADSADMWMVFWDRSANELSLKVYDDSANSWSETSIATGMTDLVASTAVPQFAGAVRNSDGHLLLLAWENADTVNAKLRCWDVNGAASITEKTNVVTASTDDQAMCALGIDTDADTLYAFYAGKTDGTETAYSALNVYYKTSANGGTTWGAETLLSGAARPVAFLCAAHEFAAGDFAVAWGGIELPSGTALTARCSAYR